MCKRVKKAMRNKGMVGGKGEKVLDGRGGGGSARRREEKRWMEEEIGKGGSARRREEKT